VKVLITGADGFIGRHLQNVLANRGIDYRAAVRARPADETAHCCEVGDIGPNTDWQPALAGIDLVVHLAARAHILRETHPDPRAEFMRVNALGTAGLVNAAVANGVRRFVYVSSVGVLGNASGDVPLSASSTPHPHSFYAESKLAGEVAAQSAGSRLEVVVLRPPLAYGPGVRANFMRLLRWIDKGWPLPLACVDNRRSLISVWNLCDFLVHVMSHAAAPGHAWMVSDGEDLSTPDLIRRIAREMGRHARLLPVSPRALRTLGKLTRRQEQVAQLCGSLQVNTDETRNKLGWSPPLQMGPALARTVSWYLSEGRASA
jgi:nucleoside-diphosphate-sugar epimerase